MYLMVAFLIGIQASSVQIKIDKEHNFATLAECAASLPAFIAQMTPILSKPYPDPVVAVTCINGEEKKPGHNI